MKRNLIRQWGSLLAIGLLALSSFHSWGQDEKGIKDLEKKEKAKKNFEIQDHEQSSFLKQNLSNVRSEDLSDEQVYLILDQTLASGIGLNNIERVLQERGMSQSEAMKVGRRVRAMRSNDLELIRQDQAFEKNERTAEVKKTLDLPIFGADYFSNTSSPFAPNNNIPTPQNYIVGPADRLLINVYGNSVVEWNLQVTPEGTISIPGIGPVYVGGKTIENATTLIKDKLVANRYAIGKGTEVAVSLANIRTIRVHINGEVVRPGAHTVSSLTTAFNSLYEAGGPNEIGSMRSIDIYRNNTLLRNIDIYDYLLKGDRTNDVPLQDGDVIIVPPYRVRVAIEGEVKRPAYYEIKPGESFKDVLVNFAGGFTDDGYRASVKAVQVGDKGKKVRDVQAKDFDSYIPLKGDRYIVERIIDRFENRVSINGAVFRPGQYELEAGLTLDELLKKADGAKEDAFMNRGTITRLKPDNTTEVISFNLRSVIEGKSAPIPLQREDIVTIPSLFDLRETYELSINGSVRKPGKFTYSEGMTVEDLILQAGGFADGANMQVVEIARRVKNSDRKAFDAQLSEIISLDIDPDLSVTLSKFQLEPFDVVSVFSLPGYVKPQIVTIQGEVMLPGTFAMRSKNDRISDLIKRANGFTAYAYLKGASLKRADLIETSSDLDKQNLKMAQFNEKQSQVSDGQAQLDLGNLSKRNDFVDIDLEQIMKKPHGRTDLILLDGDIISIPRELQTVKITGEVFSPTTTTFRPNQNLLSYVMRSGGFTEDARRNKAYVVYANGSIKATRNFLFIKNYPNLQPGAEIFIPKRKPRREGATAAVAQTWIGMGSALAAVSSSIFGIIMLIKTNNSGK